MTDLAHFIPPLLILAKQASEAILDVYQHSHQYPVTTKADHSPLTQADLLANQILTTGLRQLTPDVPVLSEEGATIPWQQRQTWQRYWLIDPLDGTLPFTQHTGEFSVNIALIKNHQAILGMIYIPITEECYYAYTDAGTHKLDAANKHSTISVRPWQPEQTTMLASNGANQQRLNARFRDLGNYDLIRLSSAWKFCRLAEGKADISPRFGDTSEWDTAAGQCILEQAGGAILDLAGNPLRYNTGESLLNPHFVALGDVQNLQPILPWGKWPVLEK